MDKEKIISLENLNQYSEETSGKIKEKIAEHTDNTNIHVTTADKSKWNSKLDSNQGTSNAGKLLGTNSSGDVVAIQGYGFEYNEETKMLKYGTDPTTNLNQGIGLDDTLSKKGYAAEASAVGELKSDLVKSDNAIKTYSPDSREMMTNKYTTVSKGTDKRWLYSSHTIGYAVQNNVSYCSIPLSDIDEAIVVDFSDLDSLSTDVSRNIVCVANGGNILDYAFDYFSPNNIIDGYKGITTYRNGRAIFSKNKILESYPETTHIWINYYTNNDKIYNASYVDEKSTNEKIDDIDEKINEIEFINNGSIQPYFKEEVESVANYLYGVSTNKCLMLNIVTDNHYAPQRERSWQQNMDTIANVKAVNNGIFCDGVVHLGDMVSQSYCIEAGATHEQVFKAIFKYTNEFRKLHDKVFLVGGNHDGSYANTWHQSEWYRLGERPMDNYINCRPNSGDYYYDYYAQKVRCIFLQTPDDDSVGFGYSDGMLLWLKNVLLSVESGWTCILFSHCPNITLTEVSGVNNPMVNKDAFETMINSYNAKSGDFTNAHGVVRLMVCGHAHGDYVSLPNNASGDNNNLGIPVVLIGANTIVSSGDWGVAPSRTDGTVTQDLWDTLVYYPGLNQCHFVRFGARATEVRTRIVDLPI